MALEDFVSPRLAAVFWYDHTFPRFFVFPFAYGARRSVPPHPAHLGTPACAATRPGHPRANQSLPSNSSLHRSFVSCTKDALVLAGG